MTLAISAFSPSTSTSHAPESSQAGSGNIVPKVQCLDSDAESSVGAAPNVIRLAIWNIASPRTSWGAVAISSGGAGAATGKNSSRTPSATPRSVAPSPTSTNGWAAPR